MLDDQFYSGQTKVYWCCDELLKGREISCETEIREVRVASGRDYLPPKIRLWMADSDHLSQA